MATAAGPLPTATVAFGLMGWTTVILSVVELVTYTVPLGAKASPSGLLTPLMVAATLLVVVSMIDTTPVL